MAGKAKMADLPEPAEKPDKPDICWAGGITKTCGECVNRKICRYEYVDTNVQTARKNSRLIQSYRKTISDVTEPFSSV